MRGLVRLQIIAAGAILFARLVVADDWPYYQHDARHTGYSSAIVNPQALSRAWTAPSFFTGGYSTPVIVGNTIYAMQNQQGYSGGGLRTRVTSFDLATGAINWTYSGSFVFPSQPGVGGGFVTFVGTTFTDSSLYVLDAVTGALRYTVPILAQMGSVMPTVVRNPVNGHVTAFVADGARVSAVSLGPASGSVRWTRDGQFGGDSIPTVVGNSIVLAGPGQYYAFDQATGAANHFWSGGINGGGGTTVAYDAARQQFYVLRILDTDRKIMVPVANAGAVGLRQVISEQEIREIFDILRERTIAFDNQTWNRRYRGFMDKIKTGSIYDVAEVLRDLYRLKTDKQLSFGERRMLDTARTLIVKEIAIARKQTEEQVKTEIEAIFVAN